MISANRCLCPVLVSVAFLASCSLKYDETPLTDTVVPELEFSDVRFEQYEGNKKTVRLEASSLEQYRNGNSYARDASFVSWSDDGLSAEGSCGLMGIDTGTDVYVLFNNVVISDKKQNFEVRSPNLRMDMSGGTLVSGRNDRVTVSKDDIILEGYGFSADGSSNSFRFGRDVSGSMVSDEE